MCKCLESIRRLVFLWWSNTMRKRMPDRFWQPSWHTAGSSWTHPRSSKLGFSSTLHFHLCTRGWILEVGKETIQEEWISCLRQSSSQAADGKLYVWYTNCFSKCHHCRRLLYTWKTAPYTLSTIWGVCSAFQVTCLNRCTRWALYWPWRRRRLVHLATSRILLGALATSFHLWNVYWSLCRTICFRGGTSSRTNLEKYVYDFRFPLWDRLVGSLQWRCRVLC